MLEIAYLIFMILFLFGITIFVHEWGHFIVARKCGLHVDAFAIGMGPALFQKKINGVLYKLCIFPIGGYVSLPQLDPSGMDKIQGEGITKNKSYKPVSPWKKIAVAIAGPLCNIIFALILGFIVYSSEHDPSPAIIGEVDTRSSAFENGLRSEDQIIKINNNPISGWYDVLIETVLSEPKGISNITVLRSGETNIIPYLETKVSLVTSQVLSAHADTVVLSLNYLKLVVDEKPMAQEKLLSVGKYIDQTNDIKKRIIDIKNKINEINITGLDGVHKPLKIEKVQDNLPAKIAGLKENDIIKSLNNKQVFNYQEFVKILQNSPDKNIPISVKRENGIIYNLNVDPYRDTDNQYKIGIELNSGFNPPWTLFGNPFQQIKNDAKAIIRLLNALVNKEQSGNAAKNLGGPVAIFSIIWMALKMGLIQALALMRFININLAILNLLPIPVLDGGHIVFSLFEGITKKRIPSKLITALTNIFALLLIGAMIILSYRDVGRLIPKNEKINHSLVTTNEVSKTIQ